MTGHSRLLIVGRVSGVYGVRGWIRVFSYMDPPEAILDCPTWHLGRGGTWQAKEVAEGRAQGKGVVARLGSIADREVARALIGADIAVPRGQLPPLAEGEYYWTDLEGLRVVAVSDGTDFGCVDHLMATGANDVLVVRGERERLIPFVRDSVVKRIDFERGVIEVDWDPDF